MQNSIHDRGLMNFSQFWVIYVKCGIMGMLVGFVFKCLMEMENIFFQFYFKFQDILLFHLSPAKFLPS